MEYRVITFYKYIPIEDPARLRDDFREFCTKNNILGRILIGEEGINGAACGKSEKIELFKENIKQNSVFSDLTFRQHEYHEQAYHKLVVRVRKEIVAFGEEVDLSKKGKYLTPDELKNMLDNKEDLVIIDARNSYEAKVGKFENAVVLPIENFREFPEQIGSLKKYQNKKIVMYCTGGIRCEKASAYLSQNGFGDVYHLKGGIIDYLDKYPNDHFKGNCFVFDDRLVADTGGELVGKCEICNQPSTSLINCHNLECDKLFICCEKCQKKKCCSIDCMNSPRQRIVRKKLKEIGTVRNYYSKPKIAEIMIKSDVKIGTNLFFSGETTEEFSVTVKEIRDIHGNNISSAHVGMVITIPILNKLRKNDMVFIQA